MNAIILPFFCAISFTLKAQAQPGSVLWSYDLGSTVSSSPVLAANGAIYLAAGGALHAITNNGVVASNKWVFASDVARSATVGSDSTIYFGDLAANLRAVNPDGTQIWVLPLQPEFQYQIEFESTPALGLDNTIYFVAGGQLYAVSPAGTKKWRQLIDDSAPNVPLSPVIGSDGTIYIGSWFERKLYAFSPYGTNKWAVSLSLNGGESAGIGADGTIYYTGGALSALSPNGSNLWTVDGLFSGSPVVSKSGTVYISGNQSHTLYAISPNGQMLWQGPSLGNHGLSTAPAVDDTGTVYYCVSNSVWALGAGGQVQWVVSYPAPIPAGGDFANNSPTIGPDGTIYAGIGDTLYAIAGTNPPSNSGWPMYQQNSRHTGKVEKPALNPPKKRADANFEFQLYAQLGQTNVIETTTNLSTWTALTNVVITDVPMDVVDLSASNHPLRFYRSLVP